MNSRAIDCSARNKTATGLIAGILLLFLPVDLHAQYFTNSAGIWTYTNINGAITIIYYEGYAGTLTVPSTINSLPVTSIGDGALEGAYGAINVTLPNSITNIGVGAFNFCSSLTSVTLPTNLVIIGDEAFAGCMRLSSISIPASTTNIGQGPFESCTALTAITVNTNNPAYASVSGVLFNKSQTAVLQYPDGKLGSSYTIPNGVTNIGSSAFSGSTLAAVTMPNSVTSIGDTAFYGTSLTNASISSNVTIIGFGPFAECRSLPAITVDSNNPAYASFGGILFDKNQTTLIQYPAGMTGKSYSISNGIASVGNDAFVGSFLTNVTIPNSVTNIGADAFSGSPLASVIIPNSITSIQNDTFFLCTSLTNVSIPSSVTNLGQWAFLQCSALKTVTIPNSVTTIGYGAFESCGLTNVTLPFGVTTLGEAAFSFCSSLQSVTIPGSVTSIGSEIFSSCSSLSSLVIPASVTNIGSYGFEQCNKLTNIYFLGNAPAADSTLFLYGNTNTIAYYLPGSSGWGSTFGGIPTALWLPQLLNNGTSFGFQTNQFGFSINWASNLTVVVEACTNFTNPLWQPVSTNTLTNGSSYFSDPQWTNYPTRFYRVRSP